MWAKAYAKPQTAICTAATAAEHSSAVLGSLVFSCLRQCCVLLFSVSLCSLVFCIIVFSCFQPHCVLLFAPVCLSKFARVSSPRSKFRSSAHTAPRVHQPRVVAVSQKNNVHLLTIICRTVNYGFRAHSFQGTNPEQLQFLKSIMYNTF